MYAKRVVPLVAAFFGVLASCGERLDACYRGAICTQSVHHIAKQCVGYTEWAFQLGADEIRFRELVKEGNWSSFGTVITDVTTSLDAKWQLESKPYTVDVAFDFREVTATVEKHRYLVELQRGALGQPPRRVMFRRPEWDTEYHQWGARSDDDECPPSFTPDS